MPILRNFRHGSLIKRQNKLEYLSEEKINDGIYSRNHASDLWLAIIKICSFNQTQQLDIQPLYHYTKDGKSVNGERLSIYVALGYKFIPEVINVPKITT